MFTTTISKKISVKEMEPNFLRMKVPKLKKHLQVREISAASKRREELLDLPVKAHEAYFYVEGWKQNIILSSLDPLVPV